MALSDRHVEFSEHGRDGVSDNVAAAEDDCVESCDGNTGAFDEFDAACWCAWSK